MSPARRRRCIDHVRRELPVSERRICRVLGQHRSTQRKVPRGADDEHALTEDVIALAKQWSLRLSPGDGTAVPRRVDGEP